ncbi:MAG: PilZ domain-containing protein [Acidobacteriia bacterium]|nr:PilZ domain-containing protein [Terriglobia bacterium]
MRNTEAGHERRGKHRFAIQREVRFKVLESERVITTGHGQTIDISSGGVAFETSENLKPGTLMELSISWPVLLDESCMMRLVVFGYVVRTQMRTVACTIERYEFRTQGRATPTNRAPIDRTLRRWVGAIDRSTNRQRGFEYSAGLRGIRALGV